MLSVLALLPIGPSKSVHLAKNKASVLGSLICAYQNPLLNSFCGHWCQPINDLLIPTLWGQSQVPSLTWVTTTIGAFSHCPCGEPGNYPYGRCFLLWKGGRGQLTISSHAQEAKMSSFHFEIIKLFIKLYWFLKPSMFKYFSAAVKRERCPQKAENRKVNSLTRVENCITWNFLACLQ